MWEYLLSFGKRLPTSVVNVTLIILSILLIQVSCTFYCTESFCAAQTEPWAFPCPEVRNCTQIGFRTFLDPDVCNCCEYCFDYLQENDTCSRSSHQKPSEMCGPHLSCDPVTTTCQKIRKGPGTEDLPDYCMRVRNDYEEDFDAGTVGVAQMNPDCDAGGWYAPRQCLPGSLCYCSNQNGNRIFGIALPNEYQDCACSRDVDRLREFGFTGKFPHCLPNGDYDELQCVVRTCYCRSDPDKLYAMHNLDTMPCYNPNIHVFQPETPRYYVKDCELHLATIKVQIADVKEEGVTRIVADMPKCDPDGSYAAVQTNFDGLYCAAPDGSQIENYGANKLTAAAQQMNCYCARAKLLLANSATGKPRCCSNGNYKPWQCIGSRCFCVDRMGRQDQRYKDEEVLEEEMYNLSCHPGNDTLDYDGEIDPDCDYEDEY